MAGCDGGGAVEGLAGGTAALSAVVEGGEGRCGLLVVVVV
jgi:hypothetical protein